MFFQKCFIELNKKLLNRCKLIQRIVTFAIFLKAVEKPLSKLFAFGKIDKYEEAYELK